MTLTISEIMLVIVQKAGPTFSVWSSRALR